MSLLILTQPGNRVNTYGAYTAEVLKMDGFADFVVQPLGTASLADLAAYDAILLTPSLPSRAEVDGLVSYVQEGGSLIVLRPSRLLAGALGLKPTQTVTFPAYVRSVPGHSITGNIPSEALQTHVPADNYEPQMLPEGAEEVARLYADARVETAFPGILRFPLGKGQVVVFGYDLAQAVALIRQGNPIHCGWCTIGSGNPYRPSEFFTGHVDDRCWHLPQADLHGILLGNAVNAVARAPQPRLWYYPRPEIRSLVVLDSDDDWSSKEAFDALLQAVEEHQGHITIYLVLGPTQMTIATPERVAEWRQRGHSFGIHHNAFDPVYAEEEQDAVMEQIVERDVAFFQERYGRGVPIANRNHCVVWKGYVELARIYEKHGVVLETNTVSLGSSWLQYLNGSGRPGKYVDTDGQIINVFQQLTQAYDDASVKGKLSADPLGEARKTREVMMAKRDRYFSPLSMLSHPVSFHTYSRAYQTACWGYANELGLPIWSSFEWADFVRARDQAWITGSNWKNGVFTTTVSGRSPQGSFTLMVPIPGSDPTRATVEGESAEVAMQEAFGWRYAMVTVPLSQDQVERKRVVVEVK